jgi:two-component system nitrogen regulation sensor histidine kinase GlnL
MRSFFSSGAASQKPAKNAIDEAAFAGLDILTSAVVILDADAHIAYANAAAEALLEASRKSLVGERFSGFFLNGTLIDQLFAEALLYRFSNKRLDLTLSRAQRDTLQLHGIVTVLIDRPETPVALEFHEIDQQLKVDREERIIEQATANRELIRNLAHEIKNPLGGIRGAAQLLELEIDSAEYREYTQVIIKEADRLQTLVDRLLAPHRRPHIVSDVNIHEVCERVRSVLMAEYPHGLEIERDYDASLPEFRGDKEQLIQALLNIVRNAAEALDQQCTYRATHSHCAPGHHHQNALPTGTGIACDRQRPRHPA